MKKLIMFLMVLMLCLGLSTAKADLVAGYGFGGSFNANPDSSGDYPGELLEGTEEYSTDIPPTGSGGDSLEMDGLTSFSIPINPCIFSGADDFSVVFWFKTGESDSIVLSASTDAGSEEEHSMCILMFSGETPTTPFMDYDSHWVDGTQTNNTTTLADNKWYHYAIVYSAAGPTETAYIDGVNATDPGDEGFDPDFTAFCDQTTVVVGDILSAFWDTDFNESGDIVPWTGLLADLGIYDHALSPGEVAAAKSDGFPSSGPKNPINIDPNSSMLVYETNATESAFRVSLGFQPVGQGYEGNQGDPYTLTVLIDPNGGTGAGGNGNYTEAGVGIGQKDIRLLDGTPWQTTDNQITLNFTPTTSLLYGPEPNCPEYAAISGGEGTSCWDYPVEIKFKAIDDPCADVPPKSLVETVDIAITMISVVGEPNLNGNLDPNGSSWVEGDDPPWVKKAAASVRDNDQPSIISVKPDGETLKTTAYQLKEEPYYFDPFTGDPWYVEATALVRLQVAPINDDAVDPCFPFVGAYVRVTMERLGGGEEGEPEFNPPTTDPCLLPDGAHTPSEPNAIVFTTDGLSVPGVIGDFQQWDVPYPIVLRGINDDKLQAEPGESEGSENYEASLEFFVDASSDKRYGESVQQKTDLGVPIPGMFEWEALEGNIPIKIQDNECGAFGLFSLDLVGNPNETTDPNIPDCYVDMWDVLQIIGSWLDCDDPHYPIDCAPFPDPEEDDEE